MSSLAELFSVEDFDSKGKKKASLGKKGNKEKKIEKENKSIRYMLPVRVCCGTIQCVLTEEQFLDKVTLDENTVKNQIRKEYPELDGVPFNLVKFNNTYTNLLELLEKNRLIGDKKEDSGVDSTSEVEMVADADENEEPLDIAEAEEEYQEEESEDFDITEEESEEPDKQNDNEPVFKRGCWVKLDIHYQELKDQEDFHPVMVKAGRCTMEIGEEIAGSLEGISGAWVKEHPEYQGCSYHYDERNRYLVPYMMGKAEIKGKKYTLPIQVGYLDQKEEYTSEDFDGLESIDWNRLRALYARKHPEYENASLVYHEELNLIYPVLEFKKELGKEQISVPVKVRGSGFVMELMQEDFQGRTSATMDEIRMLIENVYPEFSKERTEMIYDERGFVIPILKGSRKGMTISYDRKNQGIYEAFGRDGKCYRIEQMPYGCFDCREDGQMVDFNLTVNKIPIGLLKEIVKFFRINPKKEAAAQIFYEPAKNCYEVYYPQQETSECSVVFLRDHAMENEKVLVMDVHSHGSMPAFFSATDNHDEKGTRLFLVFGNLDKEYLSYKLRAGIAGNYKSLKLCEIFNLEVER